MSSETSRLETPVTTPAPAARPLRTATAGHPHRLPGPSSFDEHIVPRFRRRRGTRHARRRRLWRVIQSSVVAALVVATPLAAVTWLFTTPELAFRELSVVATPRISAAWVESQLAPLEDSNLLLLSLDDVRSRLLRHPWAAGVAIDKRLPDGLEIRLVERLPAAVLIGADRPVLVDALGAPIAPLGRRQEAAGLIEIGGAWDDSQDVVRALEVAAEFARLPGRWKGHLERVEVLGDDDYRLHATGLAFPLIVRAGSLEEKVGHLARLLPEIRVRYGRMKAVDLRFAQRIVLQPEDEEADLAAPRAPSRG